MPALIALVQDATGEPVAVHRTYLTAAGTKAAVEPVKASLGPVWGAAIRLDPEASEIVIGEGVESSASAGRLLSLPAWSAINAGNLGGGVTLPASVRSIVIAADADPAGRNAAKAAAERWQAEGRRVRVAYPDIAGQDFNDILRDRAVNDHAP
jgi:putative DNA primase/helicase